MAKAKRSTHSHDERNVQETKQVTLRWIAREKNFNKGYEDYIRGVWDHNYYDKLETGLQWQYERGRQYAAAGGPDVKDGRTTNINALIFLAGLFKTKSIT